MSDNFDDFSFDNFDDMESEDEDIVETFDDGEDDERPSLSPQEVQKRIAAYQEKSRESMRIIVKAKQYDKKQRIEALRWLGESGNHEAIPQILKVYDKDKTPGMKEEAAYALGQFKALHLAYDDPETVDDAQQRIDDIILYNARGKRASSTKWILMEIGLLALAVVLFGTGFVLNSTYGQARRDARATSVSQTETAQPTPTPDTEDVVQAQLQSYYDDLLADANFLQVQLATTTRGESIDCETDLANPSSYTLSPNWSGNETYTALATSLNGVRSQLSEVRDAYLEACDNFRPIDDAIGLGTVIIEAQRALNETRLNLNEAGIEVTEQAIATAVPIATQAATIDNEDFSEAIGDLRRIINDMTQIGGATSTTIFNWGQVVENNAVFLSGCNQPEPIIPADYVLEPELDGVSSALDSAVDNVNLGLQQTRLATTAFYEACAASAVPENATARLDQANLAQTAFTNASASLDLLGN